MSPLPGPDTRVVELRVAGLVGTSGETLLDAVSTVDVAGDGIGRIIRPADRLRRPAPGPVLPALGRAIPRTLEGYLWHGMTSGGAAKATWALLFPFSLANVAFWMLPPVAAGSRTSAALGALCRGLLRIAALLLTMLLIGQLAGISLDLLAAQCLAPASGCFPAIPDWFRVTPVRIAAGVLPVLALIAVLHRISSASWAVREGGETRGGPLRLHADPETPGLRGLHTVASLAAVALLLIGGPFRMPADAVSLGAWIATLALVLATILAAALGAAPGPVARRTLVAFAILLIVVTAFLCAPQPTGLPGTDHVVEGLGGALVVITVLFALVLAPAALLARRGWKRMPRRLRPWAGGWAAAPVLLLAGLLGGGFGAGMAVAVRQLTGDSKLRLPETYLLVTVLWGAGLALAAVLGVLGFAVAVPLRRLRRGIPEIVQLMECDRPQKAQAAAAWARSAWERRHLHHLAFVVALAMSAGGAALLVLRFGFGLVPDWFQPISAIGVVALGALAAGLLRVVYTAARTPQRSRHLGALADLVCFWPRVAHPTVPPCYALKVVPELAARAREHLAEPNTRVVLAGYNVGSVLAVMAAARLTAELQPTELARLGLLTAGSPLQWGYQRAFPALLPEKALADLFASLDGRWRSLCRGTDIFGGGVTTWRHQVHDGRLLGDGFLSEGGIGALAAEPDPDGVLILGGDHWLPDPMRGPTGRHRWAPGVLKHADYVVDAEWDHAVAMAAGLGKPSWGEQGSLFGDFPGKP